VRLSHKTIFLEPLGDIHVGNPGFVEEKLLKRIKVIKEEKNRYWIGMGDYIEAIYPTAGGVTDKRFTHKHIDRRFLTPEDQINHIAKLFEPIKNKCLGLLTGNHEWKLEDRYGIEVTRMIAEKLGVDALGPMAFITLHLNGMKNPVVIFALHGHYTGRKTGGALNNITDLASWFDADVYLMGHVHKRLVHKEDLITVRGGEIIQSSRIFCLTGSFLRSYSLGVETYAERKALPPGRIGTITVRIDNDGEIWGLE